MSLFDVFSVASSALAAQSQRLNVTASNLANADSVASPDGTAYKARQVIFSAAPQGEDGVTGVTVTGVIEDQSPAKSVFNPGHPLADAQGYVKMPNVNVVDEMVNMMSASRSYQSNVDVMNTAKTLLQKTLTLGQ
ncbi:MAG TPA: flagellar basal body rod protein FlgC [Casimicrobiaceae bacterium]